MPYYAITGRVHGDDEDVAMILQAGGSNEAALEFIVAQREQAGITPEDVLADEELANVYVTAVFMSETPIERIH